MRLLTLVLAACGGSSSGGGKGDDDDDDAVDTDTDTDIGPPLEGSSTLVLEGASNFSYTATFDAPHASLAQGDFTIDWSGLSHDMLGRPFDPGSVALVYLQARGEPRARVLEGVALGGPTPESALDSWAGPPTGTTIRATQLSRQGFPFDPAYWMAAGMVETFLVVLQDDTYKTLSAATASIGGGSDRVVFDDSARLDWTGTFSADVLATSPSLGPWTIDWSGLTEDALGNPVDPLALEQLFLGRFDVGSAAEVEAVLLDPQPSAAEWYQKYITGKTSVGAEEISSLTAEGTFETFTTDGIWLIGLRCSDCTSRIPLFAAEVRVLP